MQGLIFYHWGVSLSNKEFASLKNKKLVTKQH